MIRLADLPLVGALFARLKPTRRSKPAMGARPIDPELMPVDLTLLRFDFGLPTPCGVATSYGAWHDGNMVLEAA